MQKINKYIIYSLIVILSTHTATAFQRYWINTVLTIVNQSNSKVELKIDDISRILVKPNKEEFTIQASKKLTLKLKWDDPWFWQSTYIKLNILNSKNTIIGKISATFDEVSSKCITVSDTSSNWSFIINPSRVSRKENNLVREISVDLIINNN